MSIMSKFLAGSPEGEGPDGRRHAPDSKPLPEALLLTLPLPPSPCFITLKHSSLNIVYVFVIDLPGSMGV